MPVGSHVIISGLNIQIWSHELNRNFDLVNMSVTIGNNYYIGSAV